MESFKVTIASLEDELKETKERTFSIVILFILFLTIIFMQVLRVEGSFHLDLCHQGAGGGQASCW